MRPWDASHLPGNAGAPDWFPRVLTNVGVERPTRAGTLPSGEAESPTMPRPDPTPDQPHPVREPPEEPAHGPSEDPPRPPGEEPFPEPPEKPVYDPPAGRRPCEVGAFSGRGEALAARRRSGVRQHLVTCACPLDRPGHGSPISR